MSHDLLFRSANAIALSGWLALIVLPRSAGLRRLSLGLVVGGLCATYATLVALHFFDSGGGFATLEGVQRLFTSRPVALAGWLHYLAFDLFIGWWIAGQLDRRGVSRWLQAPVLAATFMVGPVGLGLAGAVMLALRPRQDAAANGPHAPGHPARVA